MGIVTQVVLTGLQFFFPTFFPILGVLGYLYQLRYANIDNPLSLLGIFSKIGMEVYHQSSGGDYPNMSNTEYDTYVSFANVGLQFVTNDRSFVHAMAFTELAKQITVKSLLSFM